jgi:hypothetical protein
MGGDRIGLDIVVGRAFNQGPKATVDYGMLIAPRDSTTTKRTSTSACT